MLSVSNAHYSAYQRRSGCDCADLSTVLNSSLTLFASLHHPIILSGTVSHMFSIITAMLILQKQIEAYCNPSVSQENRNSLFFSSHCTLELFYFSPPEFNLIQIDAALMT